MSLLSLEDLAVATFHQSTACDDDLLLHESESKLIQTICTERVGL